MEPNYDLLIKLQELFRCEHCGCCCRIGGNIILSMADVVAMSPIVSHLAAEGAKIDMLRIESDPPCYKFAQSSPCVMFDPESNLCKIQEGKPQTCVEYPFLALAKKTLVLQDLFCCRGAIRALSELLGVDRF